jgi:hypothetical protein
MPQKVPAIRESFCVAESSPSGSVAEKEGEFFIFAESPYKTSGVRLIRKEVDNGHPETRSTRLTS